MFKLKVGEKEYTLKWGTWAMKLFCDKRGILPAQFIELLAKAEFGVDEIVALIQCGIEAAGVDEVPNERTAADWIDELGGFFQQTGPLVDYAKYIVDRTLTNITPLPGDKAEEDVKKNVDP